MKLYIARWQQSLLGAPLTPKECEVAFKLSTYADGKTGENVRPGALRLAKDCNMKNPNKVYPVLRSIEEKGFIFTVEKGGRGRATQYRLTIPDPTPQVSTPEGETIPEGSTQSVDSAYPSQVDHHSTYTSSSLDSEKDSEHSLDSKTSEREINFDPESGEVFDGDSISSMDDPRLRSAWSDPGQLLTLREHMTPEVKDRAGDRYRELTARPEKTEAEKFQEQIYAQLRDQAAQRNAA